MTSPLATALALALLGAGFAATSAQAATPAAPATLTAEAPADARFRAIYEKEWAWRQAETGQADEDSDTTGDNTHLPDVSAAAQQARLAVWDGVLKQLDGIDPKQLSPANQINFAIYRPQVENLAAEVRLRAYEMPFNSDSSFWSNLGFMAQPADEDRCRVPCLHRAPQRCAALFRSADRQHARRPGTRIQRAARRARRARCLHRHRGRCQRPHRIHLLRAVQAAACADPGGRAGAIARTGQGRIAHRRPSGVQQAADVLPQRLHAQGTHHAGGRSIARRQGVLSPANPRIHHAGAESRADPPDRPG